METNESGHVAEIEKSLRHIAAIIKQKGREILNQYTITPPQFVGLQWLYEFGDMTIGELSQKMYLACSTTTDLIDRMEKSELVERVKDPSDRRVVRIHLLPEGERIIQEVIVKRREYVSELLGAFSEEEAIVFNQSLTKLQQQMKRK
ncbi:MarR family transcriptional regulator [Bacillus altitudinis]|uniref:MarR family winged helix-turn-helix transcriptional regulator n=1 Tax=Bacillus altitudinis TaxID=293387 RepID=UPI00397C2F72